ncbi:MAG: Ase1/PRC1/MAP65 family protein [Subtercola sp.]|nr:Ase1/PRC1/MAP65 family protein [Subtercola sp.]
MRITKANAIEFEDELARLNELKHQNLHLFVEDARYELQELWEDEADEDNKGNCTCPKMKCSNLHLPSQMFTAMLCSRLMSVRLPVSKC